MLVTTPLTRQARATILDCIMTKKIFAPCGPAGTGKTESTKDTLRMLGYEGHVHNCSDDDWDRQILELNTALLDKSNNGVIFDEFNRLTKERQAEVVSIAKKAGVWIFLTCNPGYQGGYNISGIENEAHTRMDFTVPQFSVLCRAMLGGAGFLDYQELGPAFVDFITDCRNELSKRKHYDFGLRMIKTSIETCGRLLKNPSKSEKQILSNFLFGLFSSTAVKSDKPKVMELLKKHLCEPDAETQTKVEGCTAAGWVG